MSILLDLLYGLAAILYLPFLAWRIIVTGKYRSGWAERFGGVAPRAGDRPCVWVHAVSLGEVNATRTLVAETRRRLGDCDVVVSTTTQTGFDAACREYASRGIPVFRYPLDFSFAVRRTLQRIRPDVILLMELEVWPNLLALAHRRGIPVCVANGRITEERSMRRFRMPVVRGLARRMFEQLEWVAAQDDAYADRFRELGVPPPRVHVVGTMKYDTAVIADSIPGAETLAAELGLRRDEPILVAGSTGPGEEEILLEAWRRLRARHPDAQLVIVPRKPERFDEVARQISANGFGLVRRSQAARGAGIGSPATSEVSTSPPVFLGDTMGELRKFYSLADIVFVGRSLVPMGGSDVMEVAGLARAIVIGPHVDNFAEAVAKLDAAGAIRRVHDAVSLADAFAAWLDDPDARHTAGHAGQTVVRQNTGATARTVDLIAATLVPGKTVTAAPAGAAG